MRGRGLWILVVLLAMLLAMAAPAVLVFAVLLARAPSIKVQRLEVSFHRADAVADETSDAATALAAKLSAQGIAFSGIEAGSAASLIERGGAESHPPRPPPPLRRSESGSAASLVSLRGVPGPQQDAARATARDAGLEVVGADADGLQLRLPESSVTRIGAGLGTDLARTLERRLLRADIESDVFPAGAELLHIDLPLQADAAALRRELATRAVLAFELVEDSGPDEARLRAIIGSAACPACVLACSDKAPRECYLLRRERVASARHIKTARVAHDAGDQPALQLRFTPKGSEALKRFSQAHVGRRLAIVLDGVVLQAPAIQGELGAEVEITGAMTRAEATTLARQLDAGELSAPVEIGLPQVTLSRPARRLLFGLATALAATTGLLVGLLAVVMALRRRAGEGRGAG